MPKKPPAGPLIGYARVSTQGQDLAQRRATLREAGCTLIFEEKVSGAKRNRPELERPNHLVGSFSANFSNIWRTGPYLGANRLPHDHLGHRVCCRSLLHLPWRRQQDCATARSLIFFTALGCHSNVRLCNSGLC